MLNPFKEGDSYFYTHLPYSPLLLFHVTNYTFLDLNDCEITSSK